MTPYQGKGADTPYKVLVARPGGGFDVHLSDGLGQGTCCGIVLSCRGGNTTLPLSCPRCLAIVRRLFSEITAAGQGSSRISKADFEALFERLPRSGTVVEIGTWHGRTVHELAKLRPDLKFLCIDPFPILPVYKSLEESAPLDRLSRWFQNKLPNMSLFVGGVLDYEGLGLGGSFDLIIIDGDHSRAAVEIDLTWALRRLEFGGLIMLHDWKLEGVRAAVSACGAELVESVAGWGVVVDSFPDGDGS